MKHNPNIPCVPRKMLKDFKRDPNAPDVKTIEPPNGETISSCPFCGSDAKLMLTLKEVVPFYVKCASVYCGARGPSTDDRHSSIVLWNSRYRTSLDYSQLQSDPVADFKKKHSDKKWRQMQMQLSNDGVINAAMVMRVFMFYSRVTKGVKPNITAEAVYWFAAANAEIFAKFPSCHALRGTDKHMPVCVFTAALCIAKTDRSLVSIMALCLKLILSGEDNEHSPLIRLRNIIKNLTMKTDCLFWMAMKAFDCVLQGDYFGENIILDHERRRLAKVYKLHYQ